jgi:hypothetical protein
MLATLAQLGNARVARWDIGPLRARLQGVYLILITILRVKTFPIYIWNVS